MERYVASDERPLDVCLADVAQCDLYIGIVAWRYGFIPQENNPEGRSITECELRAAMKLGKKCLLFLSDEEPGKWPTETQEDYTHAKRLREYIEHEHTVRYFDNPDKLGREVSVAVSTWLLKPDFDRYLTGLMTEFSELQALPNDTKKLALADTIKIRIAFGKPTAASGEEQPGSTVLDVFQAVAQERAWLLVGEAGQGKSTALQSLAYHFAKEWLDARQTRETIPEGPSGPLIPIYLTLSHHPRSLRDQIWSALRRPGFTCSMEMVDRWMQSKPFLFLIDRLDETEPDSVIEDLQKVAPDAPNSRFVLASRPIAALSRCPWPQARIEPLSHFEIRSLCETLLGLARGTALCDTLFKNGLLDGFRRPLFARLLALSSPDLLARNRVTPSEVFQDVLEERFLGSVTSTQGRVAWERTPDSQLDRDLLREVAASMAHEMVAKGAYSIDRKTAARKGISLAKRIGIHGDMRFADEILERMIRHGIVHEREGEVQFWHTSFRDYFAAVWMEQHVSALSIYIRSWQSRWHEALLFYFGLLRGRRLNARLRELLIGLRSVMALLSINPYSSLSRRVFLVLRCLVQAGSDHQELQRQFIAVCPVEFRHFYLHLSGESLSVPASAERAFYGPTAFCDLIGQFRIPEAFAYLNRVEDNFPTVAPGLMHEGGDHITHRIVRWLANPSDGSQNRTGRLEIAELIVQSHDERFVEPIIAVLTGDVVAAKRNLLMGLHWWFVMNRRNDDPTVRARLMKDLQATLIDLVLWQENEDLRETVVSLFHEMDPSHLSSLPPVAKAAFIEALNSPSEQVRDRALTGLLWAPLKEHMDIARKLLRDPAISIVIRILHFLRVMDRAHFPLAVIRVVRRHAPLGSSLRQVANSLAAHLDLEYPDPNLRRRTVSLLIASARLGEYNFIRRYSIEALGDFRLSWTVPMLLAIFRGDEWVETRCAALRAVVRIMGKNATAIVVEALDMEETEMLENAVHACHNQEFDVRWQPFAGHKLFRLLNNSNNLIGGSAARVLEKWGYLDREWSWYLYEAKLGTDPIYLGPTSADSFVVPDDVNAF